MAEAPEAPEAPEGAPEPVHVHANNALEAKWLLIGEIMHHNQVRALLAWRGPHGERVDATAFDNKALRLAARYNKLDVVRELLAWEGEGGKRVDPTAKDNEAL